MSTSSLNGNEGALIKADGIFSKQATWNRINSHGRSWKNVLVPVREEWAMDRSTPLRDQRTELHAHTTRSSSGGIQKMRCR